MSRRHVARALAVALAATFGIAGPGGLAHPQHAAATADTVHPRLLFSAADVPALRQRVTTGVPAQAWASLQKKVNAWSDPTNPAYIDPALIADPTPLHNQDWMVYDSILGQNQLGTVLTDLGFAYQISGNATYGRHAIDLMNALAADDWPAWNGNELGKGDLTKGVGLAFDWTYDLMSDTERHALVASLTSHESSLFSCLSTSFFPTTGAGSNWEGVCGGGNGLTLLAIYGEPGAPADIDNRLSIARSRILQTLPLLFGANGDPVEGLNYAAYGLHNALPFVFAWQRERAEDLLTQSPGVANLPHVLAYEQQPGGGETYIPRNDSTETLLSYQEVLPMLMHAAPDGVAAWVWDHTIGVHGDDVYGAGADPAYVGTGVTGSPQCATPGQLANSPITAAFCWNNGETFSILYLPSPQDVPPTDPAQSLPLSKLYPEYGLVDFRTGWSGGSAEVTGAYEAKHDHPGNGHWQEDLGQFSLYGYGAGFALDSGYGHNYSCNAETSIYEGGCPTIDEGHALGHNVVIIDGYRYTQDANGAKRAHDTILDYQDAADGTLVRSDLRTAYSPTLTSVPDASRNLVFSRVAGEPVILGVTDGLDRDGATHTYQMRVHTDAANAVAITGPGSFLVTAPTGATMAGGVAEASAAPVLAVEPWQRPNDARPAQLLVVSQTAANQRRFDHLEVLAVQAPGTVPATVTPVTATGGDIMDVTWIGGEALVVAKADNTSGVTSARATSDAALAKVSTTGQHLLMTAGSTLTVDGVSYASVTAGPATVSLSGATVTAKGPAGATYRIRAPQGVSAVTLNGAATSWSQDGAYVVFPAAAAPAALTTTASATLGATL